MFTIDTVQDIQDMARGAVFLGSGGGGDPYVGELFLRQQLAEGRHARIIDAAELADDAFVISIAGVGAPTVLIEHLVSKATLLRVLAHAEKFYGRKVDALISAEIGGANSMFPVALGAQTGLPVIDGDGMGRAFPHLEMTTFSVFGVKATPAFVMDDSGNTVTFDTINDRLAEDVVRAVTASLGSMAYGCFCPMTGAQVKRVAVLGTISQTIDIGRSIREGRDQCDDPFDGLLKCLNDPEHDRHARLLFHGKITDVVHETRDGWHWGKVVIGNTADASDQLTIEIQNEYLVARRNGRTVTVVPDLISVLDAETAEPMTAEMLIYGQRVRVIGYSAAPIMRRPECLEVFGPRLFGMDEDFVPVEQLVE
ncbi:MAG: DUF917 domain-containing protein [Sterolibacterium sp.]|jgi:hypothetical protein